MSVTTNTLLDQAWFHILIPIIFAILINYLIYYFGLNYSSKKIKSSILPPGYIIGLIWIIIFGLLGYVHYLLYKLKNGFNIYSISIIALLFFCLAYPFLTSGLQQKNATILNLITLIFAFIVALLVITQSINAFYYIMPLLIWASYVNISDVYICSNKNLLSK
jgi:tryptophan-rich sensory protein